MNGYLKLITVFVFISGLFSQMISCTGQAVKPKDNQTTQTIEEIRNVIIRQEGEKKYWLDRDDKETLKRLAELDIRMASGGAKAIEQITNYLQYDPNSRIRALSGLILGGIKGIPATTSVLIGCLRKDPDPMVRINLLHALMISNTPIPNTKHNLIDRWFDRLVTIGNDEGVGFLGVRFKIPLHKPGIINPTILDTMIFSSCTDNYYRDQIISARFSDEIMSILRECATSDTNEGVRNVARKYRTYQ